MLLGVHRINLLTPFGCCIHSHSKPECRVENEVLTQSLFVIVHHVGSQKEKVEIKEMPVESMEPTGRGEGSESRIGSLQKSSKDADHKVSGSGSFVGHYQIVP